MTDRALTPEIDDPASLYLATPSPCSFEPLVPDILSYIFLLCLPKGQRPQPKANSAPLNVSHVCRTWRDIALNTLQLWAQLHITIQPFSQSVPEHSLPVLAEWLRRSRTVNVRITIEWPKPTTCQLSENDGLPLPFPTHGVTPAHIYSLFAEISNHRERIKELTLTLPDELIKGTMNIIYTRIPVLDILDLRFYRAWRTICASVDLDQRFSYLLNGLEELSINSEVPFELELDGNLSCPMLKKLSIHRYSVTADKIIKFLNVCPQLEVLNLGPPDTLGWSVTPLPAPNPKPVASKFSSLRTLDISGNGQYTYIIGSLLDRLELPQLRKLALTFGEDWPFTGPGTRTWPHLIHFLSRSNPPLESLSLVNHWMSDTEVLRCLELLPCLRKLKIRFSQEISEALRFPVLENSSQSTVRSKASLCPLLEAVEFDHFC